MILICDIDTLLNNIYILSKYLDDLEAVDDIEKVQELLISGKKLNVKLNSLLNNAKKDLKAYYISSGKTDLKEINKQIELEGHMNLNYIKNKAYNFSFRVIKISTKEEFFIKTNTFEEAISQLVSKSDEYRGIQIIEFRCRDNRAKYIKIINSLNLFSRLKEKNINIV